MTRRSRATTSRDRGLSRRLNKRVRLDPGVNPQVEQRVVITFELCSVYSR